MNKKYLRSNIHSQWSDNNYSVAPEYCHFHLLILEYFQIRALNSNTYGDAKIVDILMQTQNMMLFNKKTKSVISKWYIFRQYADILHKKPIWVNVKIVYSNPNPLIKNHHSACFDLHDYLVFGCVALPY